MAKEQKTKKLEQTDIDSIVELRQKYAENTNTLGLITTDEYAIIFFISFCITSQFICSSWEFIIFLWFNLLVGIIFKNKLS